MPEKALVQVKMKQFIQSLYCLSFKGMPEDTALVKGKNEAICTGLILFISQRHARGNSFG